MHGFITCLSGIAIFADLAVMSSRGVDFKNGGIGDQFIYIHNLYV